MYLFFKKFFQETITVSNGFDPDQDRHQVLIWVQTVYKGYHQTTKVAASRERVKKQTCHAFNVYHSQTQTNSMFSDNKQDSELNKNKIKR